MTTSPAGDNGNGGSAGNVQKDPDTWVTGDEPATPSQLSYLETLAQDSGTEVPGDLTKARASELIDELQQKSPRLSDDG